MNFSTIKSTNSTPLCQSCWIWPEGELYLNNCYAHFRHDFELKDLPATAPLFITADQSYRLHVNGRYVCRGPARGYADHCPYDEVDITDFLQPGHNWLAVEAHNPGVSTFQYQHQAQAGFLCAAEWGETTIRTNLQSWQLRRVPGQRTDVARLSRQMGFQEDADATADNREWITSAIPPDWSKKGFLPDGQCPFGRPPWDTVEPRGIPLLRERLVVPVAVTTQAEGVNATGYREARNLSWHWVEEAAGLVWQAATALNWNKESDALEIFVAPSGLGKFQAITFDLGQIYLGSLNVEAEGATGGEIIDFQYHQCLRDGVPAHLDPRSGGQIAMATRLRLAANHCRHEFYPLFGCRHITAVIRDTVTPLRLRFSWRTAEYPFAMTGAFSCSDHTLEQIHAACRHTQQICACDAYIDTPWREQAQWWGDARVQARNTFYLDGDARLLARGIRSIAGQSGRTGLTYAHSPSGLNGCILPDFSLTWILTIWDYYWQTGSLELFHEQHNRIREILAYFTTPEACNADGLLMYDSRFWLFEDWAPLLKKPIPTFLNLWHLYTLDHYVRLLEAAHLDATAVHQEIATRRRLLTERFFDRDQGLFVAALDRDGRPLGEPSVHDQVLALLLELCPEAHRRMIDQRLLPYLKGEKLSCATPSAFWCTYLFDVMTRFGYEAEVLNFIRSRWTPMLTTGTTWEEFKWSETATQSCCHAWSAHPASHLVTLAAGLRQTAPGWATVDWKPPVTTEIDRAAATIPTPHGPLSVRWEKNTAGLNAHFIIPNGITVRTRMPKSPDQILQPGHSWQKFARNKYIGKVCN